MNCSGTGRDVTVPVNVATIVQSSCNLTCTLRDKSELLLDNKNKNTVERIPVPIPIAFSILLLPFVFYISIKPIFKSGWL